MTPETKLFLQFLGVHLVVFGALVFLLRKIMYSTSVEETGRLKKLSEENSKKSGDLARKVQEAERQYKEKLMKAEDDIRGLKNAAQDEAEEIKKDALDRAKQESEKIVAQALNSKEKIREEVMSQMQGKVIDLSCKLVSQVLSSRTQRMTHKSFLQEILADIGRIDPSQLQVDVDEGELVTPYEFRPDELEAIAIIIADKTDRKLKLTQKVDETIIAGIIIRLGSLVIDASLAGKVRAASESMREI
jgi:F0F1-type ATP synthase delta subunit